MADEEPITEVPAIPLASAVYTISESNKELRQAEIVTNLFQFDYDPMSQRVQQTLRSYTIILTQDCDLLRDFENDAERSILNGVLLYEVQPYDEALVSMGIKGRDLWKRIAENNNERFHFLESVPKEADLLGQGLPPLLIDFRRVFTLPAKEIHRQCATLGENAARRRCRLEMPYREHLQSRAAFYLQRIGLPAPHRTID